MGTCHSAAETICKAGKLETLGRKGFNETGHCVCQLSRLYIFVQGTLTEAFSVFTLYIPVIIILCMMQKNKIHEKCHIRNRQLFFFPCNQTVAALNDPLTYFWFCTKPAPRHLWLIINQALEFTTSFSADPDPKEIPICLEFLKYKHCSCCLVRRDLPYATEDMFIFMFLEASNSAGGR